MSTGCAVFLYSGSVFLGSSLLGEGWSLLGESLNEECLLGVGALPVMAYSAYSAVICLYLAGLLFYAAVQLGGWGGVPSLCGY